MLVSRVHETPSDVSDVGAGRFSSYWRLFAVPGSRRLAAADLCARLPQGMLSITVLLVAAQHASMRVAGLALAGSTFGLAATAPVRGRLADRYGIARIAGICGAGYLAAWLGLLTASVTRQQPAVLVALAAMTGCCTPPLSPGLRSLWSWQAPAQLLHTAFALDAAVFDLAYILGPVIASSLAVGITPAVALAVLLALTGAAVVIIGPRPQREASPATIATRTGPLRSAALRRLLVTAALANAAVSATEVALIALVRLHHALWAAPPAAGRTIRREHPRKPAPGHPSIRQQQSAAPDPATGRLHPRAGGAHRSRAGTSIAGSRHASSGIVPWPHTGHAVHRGRRRSSRRQRHRSSVMAWFHDERRCRGRCRPCWPHRQPAGPRPGPGHRSRRCSSNDRGRHSAGRKAGLLTAHGDGCQHEPHA